MKTSVKVPAKMIGLTLLVVFFLPIQIFAQEQVKPEDLFRMTIEELMED